MDATAGSVFVKMRRLARQNGITIVWAGLVDGVEKVLRRSGAFDGETRCFRTLDQAEKWVEDHLLEYVHRLASMWLVDKTCRDVYNRAVLHDALTSTHSSIGGAIGPSQLLKWSRRKFVPKGARILTEGQPDDGLYLLYRGHVDVSEGVAQEAHTIYPGALFNEHVVYSPPETGALFTAVAAEDSVLLSISHEQRMRMQYQSPHDAYQLLLSVLKQVEMRNPARRHHTWLEAAGIDRPTVDASTAIGRRRTSVPKLLAISGDASPIQADASPTPPTPPSPQDLFAAAIGRLTNRRGSDGADAGGRQTSNGPNPRRGANVGNRSTGDRSTGNDPPSPGQAGVQRRKTEKMLDHTRRLTDRDVSMRNLVRQASTGAKVSIAEAAPGSAKSTPTHLSIRKLSGGARLRRWGSKDAIEVFSPDAVSCSAEGGDSIPGPGAASANPMVTPARALAGTLLRRMGSKEAMAVPSPDNGSDRMSSTSRRLGSALSAVVTDPDFQLPEPLVALTGHERASTAHHSGSQRDSMHATHDHHHRELAIMNADFLAGADFKVSLTAAQLEHHTLSTSRLDPNAPTRSHLHLRTHLPVAHGALAQGPSRAFTRALMCARSCRGLRSQSSSSMRAMTSCR